MCRRECFLLVHNRPCCIFYRFFYPCGRKSETNIFFRMTLLDNAAVQLLAYFALSTCLFFMFSCIKWPLNKIIVLLFYTLLDIYACTEKHFPQGKLSVSSLIRTNKHLLHYFLRFSFVLIINDSLYKLIVFIQHLGTIRSIIILNRITETDK